MEIQPTACTQTRKHIAYRMHNSCATEFARWDIFLFLSAIPFAVDFSLSSSI